MADIHSVIEQPTLSLISSLSMSSSAHVPSISTPTPTPAVVLSSPPSTAAHLPSGLGLYASEPLARLTTAQSLSAFAQTTRDYLKRAASYEADIKTKQAKTKSYDTEINTKEAKSKWYDEDIKTKEATSKWYDAEIETKEAKSKSYDTEIKRIDDGIQVRSDLKMRLGQCVRNVQRGLNDLQSEITVMHDEISTLRASRDNKKKQLKGLNACIEETKKKRNELDLSYGRKRQELIELESKIEIARQFSEVAADTLFLLSKPQHQVCSDCGLPLPLSCSHCTDRNAARIAPDSPSMETNTITMETTTTETKTTTVKRKRSLSDEDEAITPPMRKRGRPPKQRAAPLNSRDSGNKFDSFKLGEQVKVYWGNKKHPIKMYNARIETAFPTHQMFNIMFLHPDGTDDVMGDNYLPRFLYKAAACDAERSSKRV